MSKFEFMHTSSESKSIFEIEQKAIISCFVKHVAFLLGHPVDVTYDQSLIEFQRDSLIIFIQFLKMKI